MSLQVCWRMLAMLPSQAAEVASQRSSGHSAAKPYRAVIWQPATGVETEVALFAQPPGQWRRRTPSLPMRILADRPHGYQMQEGFLFPSAS